MNSLKFNPEDFAQIILEKELINSDFRKIINLNDFLLSSNNNFKEYIKNISEDDGGPKLIYCDCGSNIKTYSFLNHIKSKKHKKFLIDGIKINPSFKKFLNDGIKKNPKIKKILIPFNYHIKSSFSNFNLDKYQIYNESNTNIDDNLNSLQKTFLEYGLSNSLNLCKNDMMSKCKLEQISKDLNIKIKLTYLQSENKKNQIYNKALKTDKIYNIGLLEDHYFINDETIYKNSDFKKIKNKNQIHNLSSFDLIRKLIQNKDKYLTPITHLNNKSPFNLNSMNQYDQLYNPTKYKLIKPKHQNSKNNFFKIKDNEYLDYKIGFLDFEAITDTEYHKQYQVCFQGLDNERNLEVNDFFEGEYCGLNFLKSLQSNYIIYCHNLKYDIQFLIKYLSQASNYIKTGSMIKTIGGYFYNNDTGLRVKILFKDSVSIIPDKLSNFSKMFNLTSSKEILPYEIYNNDTINQSSIPIKNASKFLTKNEYKEFIKNIDNWNLRINNDHFKHLEYSKIYCIQDVNLLRQGYEIFRQWMCNITSIDIDNIISLPQLSYEYGVNSNVFDGCYQISGQQREFIQRCLVGGRTMTKNNQKYHIKDRLQDFDAVSLYPSAMYRMDGVLQGLPKVIENEQLNYNFLKTQDGYFIEIDVQDIKIKRGFSLISKVNKDGIREFSNDIRGSVYVDKTSLEDLIKFQQIKFRIIRGYYFNDGRNKQIKEFIKSLFDQRLNYKKQGNPAQLCFKLIMNAFYGKTIQNPIIKKYEFLYGEDKAFNKFLYNTATMISTTKISENIFMLESYNPTFEHYSTPHIGIEILSMSKRIMNEVMCLAEDLDLNMYYQDTDSIHIKEDDIEILKDEYKKIYNRELIGSNMGQFHSDFDFKSKDILPVSIESYFLGKKCYIDKIEMVNDGVKSYDYHIRMKGIPNSSIKNFQVENLTNSKNYINPLEIYEDLYNGDKLRFELVSKKFFKYNKNFKYSRYDNGFKRNVQFVKF